MEDHTGLQIGLLEVAPDEQRSTAELDVPEQIGTVIPVTRLPGRLVFGPVIGHGAELTLADRVKRRLSVSPDPELEKRIWSASDYEISSSNTWVASAVATAISEIERDFPGYSRIRYNTLEVSSPDLRIRWRPLHALPTHTPNRARRDLDSLIDEYQGVIVRTRAIKHHQGAPNRIRTVQADVAQTNRILPWPNNVTCQGSAFDDIDSARWAAIGESVERYCGNILSTLPTINASYDDLVSSGLTALDPTTVVLHSDAQYNTPGFPLVKFTRDLKTSWVPGFSLSHDGEVWLPKSMVFVNYHSDHENPPLTNIPSYPGISGGTTFEMAVANGIEEIIERHSTMVWWHNAIKLPRLTFPKSFEEVWREGLGDDQLISGISLPNKFGLPVIAAIVEDSTTGLLTIGFGARPNPRNAFLKALTEAFTLQEGSRDMLTEDSNVALAIKRDQISATLLKPWRADRNYADSYRRDYRDISDLMAQQQLYLDPAAVEHIRPIISGAATMPIDSVPSFPARTLAAYRTPVEMHGYTIFVSDITSHDVRSAGLIVTRTIIPGLIPNFPAAFPHLGNNALQHAAKELGLVDQIEDDSTLNYAPLPHA
jgi:ribosomal protein S12 methylthiotransferase accessory factor